MKIFRGHPYLRLRKEYHFVKEFTRERIHSK